jgi:hypothetical protein
VYVDDLLIYSRTDKPIDSLIEKLKADKIWIRKEDSAAGFLGVDMKELPNGTLSLTQTGLIGRVITALGLHSSYTPPRKTLQLNLHLSRKMPTENQPIPPSTMLASLACFFILLAILVLILPLLSINVAATPSNQ